MNRLFNSTVIRIWILLAGIFMISTGVMVNSFFKGVRNDRVRTAEYSLSHDLDQARLQLQNNILKLQQDIRVLANNPQVRTYVQSDSASRELLEREMQQLFATYLKVYPEYFQIRLLDAATGWEIIRVEKGKRGIGPVAKKDLQLKKDRDYFRETIRLKPGEFYLTHFDLNREYGKVSVPYIKTIRIGAPLQGAFGQLNGVIVINVDAGQWFAALPPLSLEKARFYMLDDRANFLLHPNDSLTFEGFKDSSQLTLPASTSILLEYAQKEVEGLTRLPGEDRYLLSRMDRYGGTKTYPITFLAVINREALFSDLNRKQLSLAGIGMGLLVLGLALLYGASRRLVQPITALQQRMRGFVPGEKIPEGPPVPTREIRELDTSFRQLAERVNTQIDELDVARKTAETASAEKEQFLANFSHEIRTPLNSIAGLTEVLDQNEKLPHQQPVISTIKSSVELLLSLIGDVLDYGRILEEKLTLNESPLVVEEWLRNVCMSHTLTARRKSLELTYHISPEVPPRILTDRLRLSQILNNLVSNALKFTASGSVRIELEYQEGGLQLSVKDTGVGMTPEEADAVFKRFYQAEAGKKHAQGLGLGLAIVKHLVHLFGGTIEVESELDAGTTFRVCLPIRSAPPQALPDQVATQLPAWHLLYVDDVEVNRSTLGHLLEPTGLQLTSVGSCEEALTLLEDQAFDLVLMDLRMPETDGFECTQQVWDAVGEIPVLPLSANLGEAELNRLAAMGITDALEKPVDVALLLEKVEKCIKGTQTGLFEAVLKESFEEDGALMQKIVTDIRGQVEKALEELKGKGEQVTRTEIGEWRHRLLPSIRMLKQEAVFTPVAEDSQEFVSRLERLLMIVGGLEAS